MRVVCSQCRRVVRDDDIGGGTAARLELCAECAAYALKLRDRIPGREQLGASPRPLLVTTADGRVVAANAAFTSFAAGDHTPAQLEGWLTGDAMLCARSKLPGGCGRTMHCHGCTIRRMVAEVGRTRLARWRVPAYVLTIAGRREVCVTIRPEGDDLVVVEIEDVVEAAAAPG